jgi:hypothetical protein
MTVEREEAWHDPVISAQLLDQLLSGADSRTAFEKDGLLDGTRYGASAPGGLNLPDNLTLAISEHETTLSLSVRIHSGL